jgi:tetraacyldisaccharide 4'-kinase
MIKIWGKAMKSLEKVWHDFAYKNTGPLWLRLLLFPALLYRLLSILKKCFYSVPAFRIKVKNPVIVIGNLTVGGSGKTPMVLFLLEYALKSKLDVHLVSKGYGSRFCGNSAQYEDGVWSTRGFFGDEVEMCISRFPSLNVSVQKQRALSVRKVETEHPERVILMDDAFQYWRLQKDFCIVMVHGDCRFGNESIFPAGPLRERPQEGFARTSVVIVYNPVKDGEFYISWLRDKGWKGPVFFFYAKPGKIISRGVLVSNSPKKAVLVSSIAHPQYFRADIESLGYEVLKHYELPDHGMLSLEEQAELLKRAEVEGFGVYITEKDLPKWENVDSSSLFVLRQDYHLDNDESFFNLLVDAIQKSKDL